ncbi:MAG: ribosome maturation factor RimM [Thermomicrobiales bacterium]
MTSETNPRRRRTSDGPSPDASLDSVLLTIGRIVAAHGLRGEVKLVLTTDRPEKMSDLRRVYLDGSDTPTRITSLRLRGNDREALLKLQGINDRDEAERLRGTIVQIRGNQLPPPEEGSYFHYQILGLTAVDEQGNELGTVSEIIDAGEVDVYVVTGDDKRQYLLPALHDVVLDIDPAEGRMTVRPQRYVDEGG